MKRILNNTGAISLVEVLVTSVVFSIAAFGVYSTLSTSAPQSAAGAQKLQAAYVGKAAIEDLRRMIAAGVGTDQWDEAGGIFDPAANPHTYTSPNIPAGYTVTYTLTDDPNYPVRRVDMTVSY